MDQSGLLETVTGSSVAARAVSKSFGSGFSPWTLLVGLVFSVLGAAYVKLGRDEASVTKIACGVALLTYPYFVTDPVYCTLVGLALAAGPYALERF